MPFLTIYLKYKAISALSGLFFVIIFGAVSLIYVLHKKYEYQVFGRKVEYLLKHGYKFSDNLLPSGEFINPEMNHVCLMRSIRGIDFDELVEEVEKMENYFFSLVLEMGWDKAVEYKRNIVPILTNYEVY